MRCIETGGLNGVFSGINVINYNMRCIETRNLNKNNAVLIYDKLQHEMYWNFACSPEMSPNRKINYNMRCIETAEKHAIKEQIKEINYNMRCIETCNAKDVDDILDR